MKQAFIKNVTIIGTGRVAYQLSNALYNNGFIIQQVLGRNQLKTTELAEMLDAEAIYRFDALNCDVDLVILAVSDDAIAEVAAQLPAMKGIIVHTSGSKGIEELGIQSNRKGVFWPLQTFSFDRVADFLTIPIFIQAENENDLRTLEAFGKVISNKIIESNNKMRAKLHLAAVFVSNFSNTLYAIGSDILADEQLDFEYLQPLILESALKVSEINPEAAQTGPARRIDLKTIANHLKLLSDKPDQAKIYQELTNFILKKYHNTQL
ncbi:MAG: DUF2520 domain-containing protein [Ignavibacteria bacterium]|nr:DUF2520 domain-containing protein [Ignavibacteria bacterium]